MLALVARLSAVTDEANWGQKKDSNSGESSSREARSPRRNCRRRSCTSSAGVSDACASWRRSVATRTAQQVWFTPEEPARFLSAVDATRLPNGRTELNTSRVHE